MSMIPLLEIENLSKFYAKQRILHGISLRIAEGENLLLTGPSGSGKSTLLRLIAGLETPKAGCIWLSGKEVSSGSKLLVPPHRREIAMVFQDLALWPNLTVLGNVMLGLFAHRIPRAEKLKRAHAALESCDTAELSKRRPHQLSGGEQQRVALARALGTCPKMLLLDEPFSGVDLIRKTALIKHLRAMCETINMSVIVVSQDPDDAPLLSARIAVLEDGIICEEGTIDQLRLKSQSRTLAAWKGELD